jgi:hypothetical protein
MSRELLQQALDALIQPHPGIRTSFTDAKKYREKIGQVIAALHQELAKPEQEPVAEFMIATDINGENCYIQVEEKDTFTFPLYAAPPFQELAKPEQEPVARFNWNEAKFEWLTEYSFDKHHMKPLYLAPPRKEWVGLTDDEMPTLTTGTGPITMLPWRETKAFIRAIEAKLKEKNTTN